MARVVVVVVETVDVNVAVVTDVYVDVAVVAVTVVSVTDVVVEEHGSSQSIGQCVLANAPCSSRSLQSALGIRVPPVRSIGMAAC